MRAVRRTVVCMPATPQPFSDAPVATPSIDFRVFDARCAELGATNETARAELAGVDRATLWRWRNEGQSPSLAKAGFIADQLGITLDQLAGRAT
jgi:DNA-binding XRE family transcriptional regulator